MKKNFAFLAILVFFNCLFAVNSKLDLNSASLEEIKTLPITEETATAIWEYRTYVAYFEDVYDLRKVKEVTQEDLLKMKPLVIVNPHQEEDETAQRRDEIYYLIAQLGANEGAQEGISDTWEDYLITPKNVNYMNFFELNNLPNVSPIDAASVLIRRADGDTIVDYRDLRNTPGISYYGASNMRHYVNFKDNHEKNKLYIDYQFKFISAPYFDEVTEMYKEPVKRTVTAGTDADLLHYKNLSYYGYFDMENTTPETINKLRFRYGNYIKAGVLKHDAKGQEGIFHKAFDEDVKAFVAVDLPRDILGDNNLRVHIGNIRASYGQGLVMENTDVYTSRKTGYGFSKTIKGITGDLSRTEEYALRGGSVEFFNKYFYGSVYGSADKKDALVYDLNGDGKINSADKDEDGNYHVFSYITSTTRFDNDELETAESYFSSYMSRPISLAPRRDILEEKVLGTHLEFSPFIGTHFAFNGLNILYDNAYFVVPTWENLPTVLMQDPASDSDKLKNNDAEVAGLYSTKTNDYKRDYRRIYGFDFGTVFKNISFEGEYAELTVDGDDAKIGDDPKAMVFSGYTQYENLYFLTLYRDYDVDFDNPYARSFSEHKKFDDTLFDKYVYTLINPVLYDMYNNSSQSQAERGIYFETRYRLDTAITMNRSYVDIWERKTDSRKTVRLQTEFDFRPIYQVAFRAKYKYQKNRYDDDMERAVSTTNETTISARTNFSNRDRLQIEYRYNTVNNPPYPSITNSPTEGDESGITGQTLMHGDYVAVDYTHNLNDDVKLIGAIIFWDGHGISHWDWEDMEIDFMGEQGMKYWFSVQDRISNNLYLSLKYKYKHYRDQEKVFRKYNAAVDEQYYVAEVDRVMRDEHAFRLQLDWKF